MEAAARAARDRDEEEREEEHPDRRSASVPLLTIKPLNAGHWIASEESLMNNPPTSVPTMPKTSVA